MNKQKLLVLILILSFTITVFGNQVLQKPRPLTDVVRVKAKPVKYSNKISIPMITWGGDVATIYAEKAGIFQDNGLSVSLFVENIFSKQVSRCLSGETPYLRGMQKIDAKITGSNCGRNR